MEFQEKIEHGGFHSTRTAQAHDLQSFRQALSESPYPVTMSASEDNPYVRRAWDGLVAKGRGYLGWAVYTRVGD